MRFIIRAEEHQKEKALTIFNSAHKLHIPDYVEQSASIFDEIFAHNIVFFLKEDSHYIGFYAYRIMPNHAFLSALYIAASYQRQDMGAYLLQDCEAKIKQHNCRVLLVSVLKKSSWALHFYRKQHFSLYSQSAPAIIQDSVKNYPDEPWATILYKELG